MPTRTLRIMVGLKVTDNEAKSALEALQEKMGLRESVRDLARDELWEIDVEAASSEDARGTVEHLVQTTNLFANPNKHSYVISTADEPGSSDAGSSSGLSPDEVAVLVRDRESTVGPSVVSAIQRIGVDGVVAVRKWTRWRVGLTEAPKEGDPAALELIRKIGVATGRRDGLLSNPHSQVSRAVLPWGEEKVLAA